MKLQSKANARYALAAVTSMGVRISPLDRMPVERLGFNPWVGTISSCLRNPTDRGAWRATVHRASKSRTGLSDSACTQSRLIHRPMAILPGGQSQEAGRGDWRLPVAGEPADELPEFQ